METPAIMTNDPAPTKPTNAEPPAPMHAIVAAYESRSGAETALKLLLDSNVGVNGLTLLDASPTVTRKAFLALTLRIPARLRTTCERDMRSGKVLVLAGGSAHVIGSACAVLGTTSPSRLTAHAA